VVAQEQKIKVKCKVPNVKGQPLGSAEAALKAANCTVGKVTKKPSKSVKSGRVISTSPKAGKAISPLAPVGLTVSSGKKISCKVPKLKGKKLAAAKKAIKKAHCGVGKVTKKNSSKKNKGKVISQSPRPHAVKRKGTKVKLTVGK
jgi:serine/threonine-protein kinase